MPMILKFFDYITVRNIAGQAIFGWERVTFENFIGGPKIFLFSHPKNFQAGVH